MMELFETCVVIFIYRSCDQLTFIIQNMLQSFYTLGHWFFSIEPRSTPRNSSKCMSCKWSKHCMPQGCKTCSHGSGMQNQTSLQPTSILLQRNKTDCMVLTQNVRTLKGHFKSIHGSRVSHGPWVGHALSAACLQQDSGIHWLPDSSLIYIGPKHKIHNKKCLNFFFSKLFFEENCEQATNVKLFNYQFVNKLTDFHFLC